MNYYISFLLKIAGGLAALGILSFSLYYFSQSELKQTGLASNSASPNEHSVPIYQNAVLENQDTIQLPKKRDNSACGAPSRSAIRQTTTKTPEKIAVVTKSSAETKSIQIDPSKAHN